MWGNNSPTPLYLKRKTTMPFEKMSSAQLNACLAYLRKPAMKKIELTEEEKYELVLLRNELSVRQDMFCSIPPRREITAVDGIITVDMVGGKIVDYGSDYNADPVVRLPPTEDDLKKIDYNNKLKVRIQEIKDRIEEINKKPKLVIDKEATMLRKKTVAKIICILQSRETQN